MIVSTKATYVAADPAQRVRAFNAGGSTLYYKTTSDVSSGTKDGSIASGEGVTLSAGAYFVTSSGDAQLNLHTADPIIQTLHVSGEILGSPKFSEGIESSVGDLPGVWGGGFQPVTAETGTDTAFAEKKLFLTSLFLPVNKTLTGVAYLLGAGGGTNRVVAGLWSSSGTLLAKSTETSEGTVAGTEKTIQKLAFTSTYNAVGPALYFIGVTANGATAKLRTIPANTSSENIKAGEVTLATKNTLADVTVPTTFTAAKGVVAAVY